MMHPVWKESEPERDQLMPYRIPLFVVGVFHTLLCKSISAWHKWMRAAGGKTTTAPRTRSPSPVRGE